MRANLKLEWRKGFEAQRPGLLAANEPRTWVDHLNVERAVPQIARRLKFTRIRIHGALRDFVMHRDAGRCVWCGFAEEWELHIDHIISRRNGGSHHPLNLQVLCCSCNARKSGLVDSKEGRAHA
jgi:5-methylcytosine-specific restriction endonuclease McrA